MYFFSRAILLFSTCLAVVLPATAQVGVPGTILADYILRKGEKVTEKVNKNMELRQETDKRTCYVGEPVVATYKLYTRLKSESKLTENPSFNGFSVIDLTSADMTVYSRQILHGKEYNVYTIRKAQLYPLQAGTIELETAELENSIAFIKEGYIMQGANNDATQLLDEIAGTAVAPEAIINETVNLRSKPVSILVKPLPEAGKPASFTGAVGNFTIKSALPENSFAANEAGRLIVTVTGSGNLQLLTAPVLSWPAGIEPFEPKISEVFDKNAVPLKGSKIFEYRFSANKSGDYTIPSVTFSYFDPVHAKYRETSTAAFRFTVTEVVMNTINAVEGSAPGTETVSGINRIFNNRWWIIEFIAIVMIVGLIIWLRYDKKAAEKKTHETSKTPEEAEMESIAKISAANQQNPLEQTELCLFRNNCPEFYSILNNELKYFLARKLAVESTAISTKTIGIILDKKGIDNDTALQLQQLLQEIEWKLYTPFERNDKMNQLYQNALGIIQSMNSNDIRHL